MFSVYDTANEEEEKKHLYFTVQYITPNFLILSKWQLLSHGNVISFLQIENKT